MRRWKKRVFIVRTLIVLIYLFSFMSSTAQASDQLISESSDGQFLSVQGEIAELEELKDPPGSAIFRVKDFSTGRTLELFADSNRAAVHMAGETKTLHDILPGSKATIIYEYSKKTDRMEVVYVKIIGSY